MWWVWWGGVPLAGLDRHAVMGALLRGFMPAPVKSCAASHGGTSHPLCTLRLGQAVCASSDFFGGGCCHVHVALAVTCVSLRKPGLRSGWCRGQTAAGLESHGTRRAACWDLSDTHGVSWKVECMEFIRKLAATSEPLVCGGSCARHRRCVVSALFGGSCADVCVVKF